ncbi:hypothetical protein JYU34_009707 [Plutella xylostella]|uniref:PBZ-type domain-containing protein n=1 Tax=Plutella xylostella TaxID=51655 RepID=A0ABQ7QKN5_PLUXY|nr:hypothetical protein JYU34_009707 [Plutella xylostella]
MSTEWKDYVKDPRTICKYGVNCYQKNSDHLSKFKHPPHKTKRHKVEIEGHTVKRPKIVANDNEEAATSQTEVSGDTVEPSDTASATASPRDALSSTHQHNLIKLPDNLTYHNNCDENLMRKLFLVDMPGDFYKFFECLQSENSFETLLSTVNLQLIGPFDLLLGKLPIVDPDLYLIHWRFFFDPPEFQAILKSKNASQFHIGYFRDAPDELPVFVASNDSTKDCHITPIAKNIFGAVYLHLQTEKKKSPFTAMACQKMMDKVAKWAKTSNYSLEEFTMKNRQPKIVTKTLHGAGIVVPYNKKTQIGYRKLVETDGKIKSMFAKLESATSQSEKDKILSELQPVITYASIAVDECDFGTGLEIGINLFCSGLPELEPSALSSLVSTYSLLKRDAFSKIIQAHLKYRRKGANMSIMEN